MNKQFTDPFLTKRVKEENDEKALLELVNRHSGIYVDMVRKFGSKSLSHNQIGDILDEKEYNIYKAALDYDETRSKFSTHLANKAKYICLTEKTKNKKKSPINYNDVEFFIESTDNNPQEECLDNEAYCRIMNMINNHDDKRIRVIFFERYFCGKLNKLKPWNQIAEKVGLSTQGCINIHNKTIEQFKNRIKNEKIKL